MTTKEIKKDKVLFDLCSIIVKKIERNPEPFIKKAILRNRKSKKIHGDCSFITEWDQLLCSSWEDIKMVLMDHSERGRWLRQSCPFHGIITDDERLRCILKHSNHKTELQNFKKRCHIE